MAETGDRWPMAGKNKYPNLFFSDLLKRTFTITIKNSSSYSNKTFLQLRTNTFHIVNLKIAKIADKILILVTQLLSREKNFEPF